EGQRVGLHRVLAARRGGLGLRARHPCVLRRRLGGRLVLGLPRPKGRLALAPRGARGRLALGAAGRRLALGAQLGAQLALDPLELVGQPGGAAGRTLLLRLAPRPGRRRRSPALALPVPLGALIAHRTVSLAPRRPPPAGRRRSPPARAGSSPARGSRPTPRARGVRPRGARTPPPGFPRAGTRRRRRPRRGRRS